MDRKNAEILAATWEHSGLDGFIWISKIIRKVKSPARFIQGAPHAPSGVADIIINDFEDFYWTPAIAEKPSRKIDSYPAQRTLWVDCDYPFKRDILLKLRPSFIWKTSPQNMQAIWLMSEFIDPDEYSRDGLMGLLSSIIGADPSGVDIGQLLRVPGSTNHKREEPFKGKVLKSTGHSLTRAELLRLIAKALGFSAPAIAWISSDSVEDRSKVAWKIYREACELELSRDITFKLINAVAWNKWRNNLIKLREDIARAFEKESTKSTALSLDNLILSGTEVEENNSWDLLKLSEFGTILREPLRWVIPKVIPESGCGLLVSAPKVGKTRLAIEIALGAASGSNPMGIKIKTPKRVGFFSLEDGEYLFSSRIASAFNCSKKRIKYHWDGYINKELQWIPSYALPLFTSFSAINLSDGADKQKIYETIEKYSLDLVIIDTLSMSIGRANVGDSTDMYAVLKDLKTIAKETKCAIMFIHHTRKRIFESGETIQEKILGSTALHAWADFTMSLVKREDGSLGLGIQTKMDTESWDLDEKLHLISK